MIFKNPEIIKNLKLEFNLTRLGLSVIVLLLLGWLSWNSGSFNTFYDKRPMDIIAANSLYNGLCAIGFLFSVVWGSFLVSSSQFDETKQKTWDFVRMSSLSPFKIMVGKIFGAPAVVWVVTLLGILPATLWCFWDIIPGEGVVRSQYTTIASFGACLFAWIMMSYAGILFISIAYNQKSYKSNALSATFSIFLLGMFIGQFILFCARKFYNLTFISPAIVGRIPVGSENLIFGDAYLQRPDIVGWYDYKIYSLDMAAIILTFFAVWALIGAWQSLRRSLQYKDPPWAWIGFLITASILFNGFALTDPYHRKIAALIGPMLIGAATMAMACLNEAENMVKYKTFARFVSANDYYRAFCSTPLWIISFIMFTGLALCSAFTLAIDTPGRLFPLALIAYAIRDLMMVHIIAWSGNVRRRTLGIAVYFAIAYGLLIAIAGAGSRGSADLFYPNFSGVMMPYFWPVILGQIMVIAPFLFTRWRKAFGKAA